MSWAAVTCPQCSAPLPRVALWRSVKCEACGSLIHKTESLVKRDTFRQALDRARQSSATLGQSLRCGGQSYALVHSFGRGEISEVFLGQRVGAMPLLVAIKVSSASVAKARYQREAQVLRELQAAAPSAHFFPEVIAQGVVEEGGGRHALVFRHAHGCWGSLAALNERFPDGLDPRHAVWIWRRMLAVLGYVHSRGWTHGDVRPEHVLVQPADHGVQLIGWASARKDGGAQDRAEDLRRSANVVRVLLSGASAAEPAPSQVPAALLALVNRACQDQDFCNRLGAAGLDAEWKAAAQAAFGAPAFVPLNL